MSKLTGILAILLCLTAATAALGQDRSAASGARAAAPANTAGSSATSSLPEIGDMVKIVDKATAPGAASSRDWAAPVKLAMVFTLLALLPALLVMMTSFTRIVIVLGFVRRALTTQTIPPNVAIIGLAIFLTIFTMSSTLGKINEQAVRPYLADKVTLEQAIDSSNTLLKDFMLRQTRQSDLGLFVEMSGIASPKTAAEVPMHVAIPSFAVSEFRTSFEMGCLLFIPFLLVDLVISGILLSAGMMMLPPVIISLPFKIILFVLVDGWRLLAKALVSSFN